MSATKTADINVGASTYWIGLDLSDVDRLYALVDSIQGRAAIMRRSFGETPGGTMIRSEEADGFNLLLRECGEAAEHIRDILDASDRP